MFDLSGMTALVTGASGGIGSAIARALPCNLSDGATLKEGFRRLVNDYVSAPASPVITIE